MRDKILVIDDEKPTLKMFKLFLDVYGFDILTAESGEEGLEVFDREHPEIVLTDVKMPGMDGIEVLQKIKRRAPATEVIVITGHGDMDLAIQALNLDATDFINKPIQRQALEQGLARAQERLKLRKIQQDDGLPTSQRGQTLVLHLRGNVSSRSERALQEAMALAQRAGLSRLALDFDHNTSINGAGIATLMQCARDCETSGLEMVMSGLSENFREVFGIVGLTRLARLCNNLDEACA